MKPHLRQRKNLTLCLVSTSPVPNNSLSDPQIPQNCSRSILLTGKRNILEYAFCRDSTAYKFKALNCSTITRVGSERNEEKAAGKPKAINVAIAAPRPS